MIWLALFLLAAGIFLSAFFSGSETGFYRVSRIRLVLDGLGGDRMARLILWMTNNPSLFVATTLIGNNLANYMTSLAIVLLTTSAVGASFYAELLAPVVFAPLLFVYGELLPKNLFYLAPNRLLRRGSYLFAAFGVLFAPIAAVLWLLGRALEWLVGESPQQVQLTLARRELQRVFEEGHEAGLLKPTQRRLAQALFADASQPVGEVAIPAARFPAIRQGSKTSEVLRLARRQRLEVVAITPAGGGREPVGYVRTIDLILQSPDAINDVRPLLDVATIDSRITVLSRMRMAKESMARVVDGEGRTVGLVTDRQLTEPLVRQA